MNAVRDPSDARPGRQSSSGESVLDLRQRLWQVLRRAADEAARIGADEGKTTGLIRLAEAAREPFLLVIAGEVNSGKSTFVNAFFREEVTQSDVLPTTETVLWFRHGEASDEPWHDDVIIRRRPTPFLRDFHVVDTPGTNSIVIGHDATTERFLPMADLVVLVLPITNPWSASAWAFLGRLRTQWMKRVVIVLQQADLLDARAIATVCGHVRGRLHAAFGEVFSLFPVSAKMALRAHQSPSVEEQRALWEASGFSAVETYLRERVGRYESRLLKMRNTVEAGLSLLRQLGAVAAAETTDAPAGDGSPGEDAEDRLVQEIDQKIDEQERFALAAIPAIAEPLIQRWRELEVILPTTVEERMGVFSTLRAVCTGERTPRRIGQKLRGSMGEAGEQCRQALQDGLRERGTRAWEALRSHLAETYEFPLRLDTPDGSPNLAEWAAAACSGVAGPIAEAVAETPVEEVLARKLSTRSALLRGLGLIIIAILAAGFWAWREAMPLPSLLAAAVAAVSAVLVTTATAQQAVQPMVEATGHLLEEQRDKVSRAANDAMEQATREFFRRFTMVFDPIRRLRLADSADNPANHPFGAVRRDLELIGETIDGWTRQENDANSGLSGRRSGID